MIAVFHSLRAPRAGSSSTGARQRRLHSLLLLPFSVLLLWLCLPPPICAAEWEPGAGFRSRALQVPTKAQVGFTLLDPAQTGILFTNRLAVERGLTNQILFSGSGVAAGDYDGDGWCDLYFCRLDGPNALYRNLGGWKFQETTAAAGLTLEDQDSSGAVFADIDGDGDLDLIVTSFGKGARLFLNQGSGRFVETTDAAGLNARTGSTTLTLADIDGDGDLDLYVTNYRVDTFQDQPGTVFRISSASGAPQIVSVNGRPFVDPEIRDRYFIDPLTMKVMEHGEADVLFRNEGGGKFSRVSWTDGTFLDEDGRPSSTPRDWGLTAMFRDINGDGFPDLYVCNDFDSPDRIWINDGTGRFRAIPRLALRKTCFSSMAVDFADINRDGWDDLLVSDMLAYEHTVRHTQMIDRRPLPLIGRIDDRPGYMQNTLFLNRGDGTYAEIAQLSGVDASDWSWLPVFLDVDLDGYEDILINNGLERSFRDSDARRQIDRQRAGRTLTRVDLSAARAGMPPLHTPNFAFRNRGDLTFECVSAAWGFDSRQVSHGMALADLDNDGDLDVVVNCMNAPALVYCNRVDAPRIAVRLRGQAPNTRGIGARIQLLGTTPAQAQEMICGGRYLSADDALRVFATCSATNRLRLEILWRSGRRSVVDGVRPNHLYEIDETGAVAYRAAPKPPATPIFRDVSDLLRHQHHEEPFDEPKLQPLLSRRFAQLGPAVAWHDLDANGWEDLLIGTGRGGQLTLFLNEAGRFTRLDTGELTGTNQVDQAGVLGWSPSPDRGSLLIALSNYEGGGTNVPALLRYDIAAAGASLVQVLPGQESSSGVIALADIEGDGDLDLFVGGRLLPGRYPAPTSSLLFRNQAGRFERDAANCRVLDQIGLVSSAAWSDLNGDGFPELLLACDWGPIRVFQNHAGQLTDATAALGLDAYRGWWNGVATGDLDNDGQVDIVASNWGRNTKYQRYLARPLRAYFGELTGDGSFHVIEAHFEPALHNMSRGDSTIPSPRSFHSSRSATRVFAPIARRASRKFSSSTSPGSALWPPTPSIPWSSSTAAAVSWPSRSLSKPNSPRPSALMSPTSMATVRKTFFSARISLASIPKRPATMLDAASGSRAMDRAT